MTPKVGPITAIIRESQGPVRVLYPVAKRPRLRSRLRGGVAAECARV